jgi:DNA-binding CsgD family transcriptional regulator
MGRQRSGIYSLARRVLDPAGSPIVLVDGAPGSGRSHVLAAVADLVEGRGGHSLRGRALEGHASMAGALTSAVIAVGGEYEARGRHVLERIQVWHRLPGALTDATGHSPAQEALREAAESLTDLLRRQARTGVGVLALDDVDPDDPATEPVLLALTAAAAPHGGSVRTLCSLRRPGPASWVWPTTPVPPLSADEIEQLVLDRLDHRPTDALVRRVLVASAGNPSLVIAALDAWRNAGDLHLLDGRAVLGPAPGPLPEMADHPMLVGADQLGPVAGALARVSAVLGPFTLRAAYDLVDASGQEIRRAQQELQRCGILTEQSGWCAVPTDLGRQILAASVGPARRRRWHAVAGTLLAGGSNVGSVRLVEHVAADDTVLPPDQGQALLLRGCDAAEDPHDIARWAQAVLAIEGRPADSTIRALQHLVAARSRIDDLDGALEAATELLTLADPSTLRLTDGTLSHLVAGLLRAQRGSDLLALVDELVRRRPNRDDENELHGLAVLLDSMVPTGDKPPVMRLREAQEASAALLANPATTPGGKAAQCLAALVTGDRMAGLRFAGEHDALVAAGGHEDWPVRGFADQCLAWSGETLAGESPQGDPASERPLADDLLRAFGSGRWAEAVDLVHLHDSGHARPSASLFPVSVPGIAALLWSRRGRLDWMRRWADQAPTARPTILARAEASWLVGDPEGARDCLLPWLEASSKGVRLGIEPLLTLLVEIAVECSDPDLARRGTDLLTRCADQFPMLVAPQAFALRASALTSGDPAPALRSATLFAGLHRPFEEAGSLLAAARLGADPSRSALPAQALLLGIGARPWSRKAELLARTGSDLNRRAPGPPVSDVDLATLVAEGLSNRQVAAWAGLSVRTVEARLSALFVRTGCASRTALTTLHAERGRRGLSQLLANVRGSATGAA